MMPIPFIALPRGCSRSTLLALCTSFSVMFSPVSQALENKDFAELEQALADIKTQAALPFGTAIALVQNGQVVYQHYSGYADIQHKKAVSAKTVFYIASATKPFTALAFLLLAEQKKLDMQMSLQQMWPQLHFKHINASQVTLRQLLTHQSGADNQPLVWATAYSGEHNPSSLLQLVAQSVPDASAKNGDFSYSNVGYNIASLWLDTISGQPWQQQLQQLIFDPLQMKQTSASRSAAKDWPLALPYSLMQTTAPLYLQKTDQTMHAAGGMLSSAPDLAKFLLAQMPSAKTALPAHVIRQSQQPQASTDSSYGDFERKGYAYGWYTGPYKNQQMLHHFGAFAGFSAHLSLLPQQQMGLVILHNEDMLSKDLNNLIADYCYGLMLGDNTTKTRVLAGFAKLQQKLAQLPQIKQAHQQKILARSFQLSLPVAAYTGLYQHPELGKVKVSLNARQQLLFQWGALQAVATGFDEKESVRLEWVPNSGEVLRFEVQQGKVQQLVLGQMVFYKQN
ncbi:serine hydrolase domain-containing protein [Rheinheimera sp. 4Y26]|uniref:serine hydrolase domain-containing protein n=1 Tax=Rheinheimera sp. 4Y26 TaxID=2977811 RepID=UPI0021B0F1B2|nr:serine hydrolase domain-containing protein [Rheinheimera sp. 4Y26]MCT6698276.1 serine hydrolase [Rheinheimera sp. 4Y26]